MDIIKLRLKSVAREWNIKWRKKLPSHSSFHSSTSVYQFCASTPDELGQLRRFFTKIFGRSLPAYPSPRMNAAVRKRWICESQGWIMAGAVHRCKPGGGEGEGRGARWLGRNDYRICPSARTRGVLTGVERGGRAAIPGDGRSLGTTLRVLLLPSTPNKFRMTT